MREVTLDGEEKITEGATMEAIKKAIDNPRNAEVHVHKPGSTFNRDGVRVKVTNEGKIVPVESNADRKKKRKAQKAARKKNR